MHKARPLNIQAAKIKLNELFVVWLNLPESQDLVQKLASGVKGSGSEILLDVDPMVSPIISLDRAALAQKADDDRTGTTSPGPHQNPSFTSPPRSPRSTPTHLKPVQQIASPLVDELDVAHRQGAMSPHGSPRHGGTSPQRLPSPENTNFAPTSPNRPRKLNLGPPAQHLENEQPQRLSAAFAQLDQTPPSPNLSPNTNRLPPSVPSVISTDGRRESSEFAPPAQEPRKLTGEPQVKIAPFFFPKGRPTNSDEADQNLMKKLFEAKKQTRQPAHRGRKTTDKGYTQKNFRELTSLCGLPEWLSNVLFRRVAVYSASAPNHDREREASVQPSTVITYPKFKEFFDNEMAGSGKERRLFDFIKWDKQRDYIVREDLRPIVEEVLLVHPGLDFLKMTPDFQDRYADTVQIRMLFSVDVTDDGRITWNEFQNSSLFNVLHALDTETDINVSYKTEYFSYEHFYVLYCKFWELDSDHDFYISKEDLSKYGNFSLTRAIIDRIFAGHGRKLRSDQPGKMSYEDFVWFCLCEEDKTTPQSLEYWFRCTDLDADGVLSGYELEHFFAEQKQRMETYQEVIAYEDILCQMIDIINPKDKKNIRLSDIKNCKLSGNFFNSL
eukprot:Sspe_Gene.1672::Locus_559_Transcript_1_1_Confidence_1.000_Length_1873::g.1672::m.1672/K11583/PPP2R3; serine/threonine-protein phosphatase 2A regulatory subunit B''